MPVAFCFPLGESPPEKVGHENFPYEIWKSHSFIHTFVCINGEPTQRDEETYGFPVGIGRAEQNSPIDNLKQTIIVVILNY